MKYEKPWYLTKRIAVILCVSFAALLPLLTSGCSSWEAGRSVNLLPREPIGNTYFVKQKVWAVPDKFIIKNEYEEPVFYVKGKLFTFGKRLSFRDLEGNELVGIKQKVISLLPRYRIYRDNKLYASVKKKLTLLKDKYIIDVPGPDDYLVAGNIFKTDYVIKRRGQNVAFITKKLCSIPDIYRVEIAAGEDDILLLAFTLVVDMVIQNEEELHGLDYMND